MPIARPRLAFLVTLLVAAYTLSPALLAAANVTAHHRDDAGQLVLTTDAGRVTLTAYAPEAIGVFHEPAHFAPPPPSFGLDPAAAPVATATVTDHGDHLVFAHGPLTATITKSPLHIAYHRAGQPLLAEEGGAFAHEALRGFRFHLAPGEKLLGAGQRVLGMDRRGHRLPLYNRAHYGYTTESEQMYFGLPMLLSSRGYMLFFDNPARGHLDLGHTEPAILQFEAVAGRLAYVVVAGPDLPAVVGHTTAVTGRQPLPPRWALGNFASRFGYRSEGETRDVVRRHRDQDIPLDAVVLDLFWFGPTIKGTLGNLDWDRSAFPEPEKMIADFAADGVRTILITEPFVLETSTRWDEARAADALATNLAGTAPRTFEFYFGRGALIDVFHPPAADWFWSHYRRLLDQGVGGWWGDLGEPELHPADTLHRLADGRRVTADEIHNAYGHTWAALLHDRLRAARPAERPMILMRSGFIGSQRHGMIPWTGDVNRSWDGLKPQVELGLTMSLLGLGYIHSDLGGFAGGEAFDPELYIRWLQFGVFQPVYRPHADDTFPAEPVFHPDPAKSIVREFIKLRYALLPYHYTLAHLNSTTGAPLMRPLAFADPTDPALLDNATSFLWGDAFLVTPVTEPGVETVDVPLPPGVWIDFFTGARHDGGETIEQATTLETLPVLVRAGSFIPMVAPVSTTRDYSSQKLTLHYYADPSVPTATGLMYEDDGATAGAYEKNQYELLRFAAAHDPATDALRFNLTREAQAYPGMPATRDLTLVIHRRLAAPRTVRVNDAPLPAESITHDPTKRQLTLTVPWTATTVVVEID